MGEGRYEEEKGDMKRKESVEESRREREGQSRRGQSL